MREDAIKNENRCTKSTSRCSMEQKTGERRLKYTAGGIVIILSVHWINATRVGEEKKKVENVYTERLLDLFGSAAKAAEAKEQWKRLNEPPVHPWVNYTKIAQMEATAGLLPSEKRMCCFIVKFS